MFQFLPLEISDSAMGNLTLVLFFLILALPAYPAYKSAQKGISKHEALLPCSFCKKLIPATSIVCPHCRQRAGHDIFSPVGKKLDRNIKGHRFMRTYLYTLMTEIITAALIGIVLVEGFGLGK